MSTTRAQDAARPTDAEALTPAIERLVNEAGHHLYDLTVGSGSLRVLVATSSERATGVGIDDLTALSRAIARLTDTLSVDADRYTLEVSTPGLERPLRNLAHFRSAVGEQVRIKAVGQPASPGAADAAPTSEIIEGQLVAVSETSVTVVADGDQRLVDHADIRKARTVFDPKGATK